jgi:hypothetical protein
MARWVCEWRSRLCPPRRARRPRVDRSWIEEAASHCRMSVSTLFDIAVTEYVKAHGFEKKPPER